MCEVRDDLPVPLVGEFTIVDFSHASDVMIKLSKSLEYFKARNLSVSTHRVYYSKGKEFFCFRLDMIESIDLHGWWWQPKKVVLQLNAGIAKGRISIRFGSRFWLNKFVDGLSQAKTRREWEETKGFNAKASVGGIQRVLARAANESIYQTSLIDAGMSDLNLLKSNATEVLANLGKLNRGSSQAERVDFCKLLDEFVGLETSGEFGKASNLSLDAFEQQCLCALRCALECSSGAMLFHDAFCLLNRSLKLERILSPGDFLELVSKLHPHGVGTVEFSNYKLLVLSTRFDVATISAAALKLLGETASFTVAEFGKILAIANLVLVRVILEQVERELGSICRDNGGEFGDLRFFSSLPLSIVQQ